MFVDSKYFSCSPWSEDSSGVPIPCCHNIAVSYTKVSLNRELRSLCCHPPVAAGE